MTLSPLVDIRGRIVDQAPVEVFRVTADEAAYWRTTALDEFDGSVWGFSGKYSDAGGQLPVDIPPVETSLNRQTFTISGLADIWLPAAYLPSQIDQGDVKFDSASSTIIGRGAESTGLTYSVVSVNPTFTAQQLIAADGPIPADIRERYTVLPADFSPVVRAEAERIVAGTTSRYEQMRKLQDYFIGNFTYDINVGAGHGTNRAERFLTERRGYCEQFAGTFAAMARHLGVPTRVAVGFTWGEPLGDNTYAVRGEHYHAWPEVYFNDLGWVPFEPTPTRGAPGAQAWTGVPEQQANETPVIPEEDEDEAGSGLVPQPQQNPLDIEDFIADPGLDNSGLSAPDDGGLPSWVLPSMLSILGAALVVGGVLGGAIWLRRRKRLRRRQQAVDEAARIEAAWADLVEALVLDGFSPYEAETRRQFAARVGQTADLPSDRLDRIARVTDHAAFGAPSGRGPAATALVDDVEIVVQQLRGRRTRWETLRRDADPRPLLSNWPKRRPGSPLS